MEQTIGVCMDKAAACFESLQGLTIQATLGNLETLVQTLYDLREIHETLGKIGGEADGRHTPDPDGRDDH